MAAKKKMSAQEQWDQAVKSGAIRPLKQPVQESVSSKGATVPAKGVKTTNVSRARGTGSESRLGSAVLKGAELIARGTLAVSGVDAAGNATKSAVKNPNPVNIARAVGTTALSVGAGPIAKATSRNTYLFGRTVVHGSPQSGLKQINPRTGSEAMPKESVAFAWNPKVYKNPGHLANDAFLYSKSEGSVYVGKVPRGGIVKNAELPKSVIVSSKPIKVKQEITLKDKSFPEYSKAVDKATKVRTRNKPNVPKKTKSVNGIVIP